MVVTEHAMQALYARYVAAHDNFTEYQARKRIMTVRGIDFSGIEAFTYDALVDLIGTTNPNEEQLAHKISQAIGEIQSKRTELSNFMDDMNLTTNLANRMSQATEMLDLCVDIAQRLIALFNRIPRDLVTNDVTRVQNIAQNITQWESDLRAAAARLAAREGAQLINVVPTRNNPSGTKEVANLRDLQKALLGTLHGSLGKAYEVALGFLMGEMGSETLRILERQLENWTMGGVHSRPSARGALEVSATIDNFIFQEGNLTPLRKAPKGTLIDWFVDRQDLEAGFNVRLPISQKIYLDNNNSGEINLASISSKINSKVLQVATSIPEAYALFRAFASPSSRGPKGHEKHLYNKTRSLAEAIVKNTFFDDTFGSTIDNVSDILINRVLYSASAVVDKILNHGYLLDNGAHRFNILIEKDGSEPSENDAEKNAARATEFGAAGVWISNDRLQRIKSAAFEVHWIFETKWFENQVVTKF